MITLSPVLWTIVGSLAAIGGVVLLLLGAVRGEQANTREHGKLTTQIQDVETQIQNVDTDVKALRDETREGFKALSTQITNLNSGGSDADANN